MTALVDPVTRPLGHLADGGLAHAASGPSWLAKDRRDAARWVEAHGFPTRKDEDWRYLPLGPVLTEHVAVGDMDAAPAAGGDWAREALDACSLGLGGNRLVFVNGRFAADLSRLDTGPHGARVSSIGPALAGEAPHARPWAWRRSSEPRHAFDALNVALATDGALVEIPDGVVLDEVIELVYFTDPGGRALLVSPRSLLFFGKESKATIVETYAGAAGSRYCTNAVTEVVLGPGADVEHYRLQAESERAFHFSSLDVRQASASHLGSHLVALGSEIARHEVQVLLDGEGAALELDALYLPRGAQHHDHPVLVDHVAPSCTSRQRYVGIVDDHAHGVFNGHVVVRPGAAGTDASQSNKNLLLSDHAEVDTRPRLEIFTDDVVCAHGAAIGRLDADALFYLRSRGIPGTLARGLLVQGFATQALEQLALAPFRARAEALLAGRLALDDGASPSPMPDGEPIRRGHGR
ncbi:MAG: Fe-S cluster assembly protein SufD [Acidimicrobiales bacterium]